MTNMSQFSDEISFVESSSIFDEKAIQGRFQSARMRGGGGGGSENIVQPDSPVAGTSGSQNTVFKKSHRYRDLMVFTAGQTWTFM